MSKVFFDTNVFIYMFEGLEPNRSRMLEIRKRMLERGDRIVTSAMTLGEVLIKPIKSGQTWLIEQYDRAIRSTAQVVNFDASVARRYASLRAAHPLRNAAAIQLACAAHIGVDLFITSDKDLHKLHVPGIGFIAPIEGAPVMETLCKGRMQCRSLRCMLKSEARRRPWAQTKMISPPPARG